QRRRWFLQRALRRDENRGATRRRVRTTIVFGDRTIVFGDAQGRMDHLLTLDAVTAGMGKDGEYVALCGGVLLPAAMVAPPFNRRCEFCFTDRFPAQRTS